MGWVPQPQNGKEVSLGGFAPVREMRETSDHSPNNEISGLGGYSMQERLAKAVLGAEAVVDFSVTIAAQRERVSQALAQSGINSIEMLTTRGLIRRAHETDPEPVVFDITEGLADLQQRAQEPEGEL